MFIKISIIKNHTKCMMTEAKSLEALATLTIKNDWCPGLFKDNYRNLDNFIRMEVIALDFDDGMSLEAAALEFSGYKHIITTSRSHGKEKNGKVADRFRVILFLDRPITSDEEYKATFHSLREKWPEADPACSDASRQFFKGSEIVQWEDEENSKLITPSTPKPKEDRQKKRELSNDERGKLSRSTLEFLSFGAESGTQNARLFKAAKDMQEQGFDEADAIDVILNSAIAKEDNFDEEKSIGTIESAFRKEPKYDPRIEEPVVRDTSIISLQSENLMDETFKHLANPMAVRGISTGWKAIDDVLGGLRESELIILQAFAKSGKSIFLTNMMANLTAQGHKVGFASLEMHPAKQVEPDLYSILLEKNVRKGISDKDKKELIEMLKNGRGLTYFNRVKRPSPEDICNWIKREHLENGINFFFIDHFAKFVPDESSVASISKTITSLTGIKYELPKIHIQIIIQPTKATRTKDGLEERVNKNTLRGGACLFEEADALINMHNYYLTYKETQVPWGWRREYMNKNYPKDIRELEFAAIRAKPFSENMGAKVHMKYDKETTKMDTHIFIEPEIERSYMPEREEGSNNGGGYNNNRGNGGFKRNSSFQRPQSGWARKTFGSKKL